MDKTILSNRINEEGYIKQCDKSQDFRDWNANKAENGVWESGGGQITWDPACWAGTSEPRTRGSQKKPNQVKTLEECHEHIYVLELLLWHYYRGYNREVKNESRGIFRRLWQQSGRKLLGIWVKPEKLSWEEESKKKTMSGTRVTLRLLRPICPVFFFPE